jgi:hypothetical protein
MKSITGRLHRVAARLHRRRNHERPLEQHQLRQHLAHTNRTDNGIGKVDYHINSKHTVNYTLYRSIYTGQGEDFPQVNPVWLNAFPENAWTTSGNWIWTASSAWVNEFRVGFSQAYACLCGIDNKLADRGRFRKP